MEWKEEYSIGVQEIDQQHMQLVRVISSFNDSISDHSSSLNREMGSILVFLVNYTHYHFSSEEAFMARIHYPELNHHKTAHAQLVSQLKEVLEKLKTHQSYKPIQFYYFLMKWLTDHIAGEDHKIGDYLEQQKDRIKAPLNRLKKSEDLLDSIQYNMKKLNLMISNQLINEEEKTLRKMDYLQRLYKSLAIQDLESLSHTLDSVSLLVDKKYLDQAEEAMLKQMIFRSIQLEELLKKEGNTNTCLNVLEALAAQKLISPESYNRYIGTYRAQVRK